MVELEPARLRHLTIPRTEPGSNWIGSPRIPLTLLTASERTRLLWAVSPWILPTRDLPTGLTIAPVSGPTPTVGHCQHFHLTRLHAVDDGERESAQHETTPACINDGPPLGSFGDAKQGPLELGQECFGRIGVALAVPARRATCFCHSIGMEGESWIKLHASRI